MKVEYRNRYVVDLIELENLIYANDFYRVGKHPYDTINIGVKMASDNKGKMKYLLLFSVSTSVAKDIKSYSRSLTMNDITITFIDSADMIRSIPKILSANIRTFPFKNIYERASHIIGKPKKEYICSSHIVTMTDTTNSYGDPQITIDVEGVSLLTMIKLRISKMLPKIRKGAKNINTIDSFYNIEL